MDLVTTPYGDVWFVIGLRGERLPMYSNRLAEDAAIVAFLAGEYGSLLSDEIAFMREAAHDARLRT